MYKRNDHSQDRQPFTQSMAPQMFQWFWTSQRTDIGYTLTQHCSENRNSWLPNPIFQKWLRIILRSIFTECKLYNFAVRRDGLKTFRSLDWLTLQCHTQRGPNLYKRSVLKFQSPRFRNQKWSRLSRILKNRQIISHGAQKTKPLLSSDSQTRNGRTFCAPETKKQAHAMWQWYNICAAWAIAGKQPPRINLDEIFVFVPRRWERKHRIQEAKGASFWAATREGVAGEAECLPHPSEFHLQ